MTRLKVPTPDGDQLFATKEGVETQAAQKLSKWFEIAQGTPICQHIAFFDDFGFLGDGPAAAEVLNGTYVYLDDMESYTRKILEQAREVFSQMSDDEVTDIVTTQDFQEYWQHAPKDIQSSESGVHFGHYKAASFDRYLSAMQAAKLMLAAQSGVPLAS